MRIIIISLLAVCSIAIAQQVASEVSTGEKLAKDSDCSGCHAATRQVVGPSYAAIAKKFASAPGAADKLAKTIREGGSGNWGTVEMPAHPEVTQAQAKAMVTWIFSLKDAAVVPPNTKGPAKIYSYKTAGGVTRQTDFPLYAEGKGTKITKGVFKGYALYNSYCFRCHGTDANGGELGPDLKASLTRGMKQRGFMIVAMAGKADKGMPSWAGFITEDEMIKIYRYVKGRSLDLIPPGRPPSEMD